MTQFSVTVVIPVWNQWQFTSACLQTLRPTLGLHDTVVVVDNGSEDFTPTGLKQFPWLSVITNDENRGIAHARNQGAAAATGDIIVFLDNDTVLSSRWLDSLTSVFADPSVAAAGPRSNEVPGAQVVDNVDYTLERMSDYRQWAKSWRADNAGLTTDVWSLGGFCLAVRRSAFDVIGGFDEQFEIGGREDDDLCRRLAGDGRRLLICHESYVHHVGNMTFEGNHVNRVAVLLENNKRFRAKHQTDEKSDRPLLAACMIIKNEADNISRCLTSLNEVVDEVVIYDTGSTDGSVEMARMAGATVIEGHWDDDFARARNEALAHCSSEWILHIDADEEFKGDAQEFRDYLLNMPLTALQLETLNLSDNEKNNLIHRPCRLFKSDIWHWTGRLHEQVTPRHSGPRPGIGISSCGSLIHHGYKSAAMTAKNKVERNIRIAELDAGAENGRDKMDKLTNLGRSLSLAGRNEEALTLFNQARDLTTDSPVILRTLHRSGAQTALALRRPHDALDWANELGKASDIQDNSRYFRGMAYIELGDWDEAVATLEGLQDMSDDDGIVFPQWTVDVKLASAYASLERWEEAATTIEPAAIEEANDEAIWALVAEAFWRSGRDIRHLFAKTPPKQLNAALAQLSQAPAEAADYALEGLWTLVGLRNNVLALAIRTAPQLAVERALEWSARLRDVDLGEHCPLVAQGFNTELAADRRLVPAAIAYQVFDDPRALSGLRITASSWPKNDFILGLSLLNELCPALLGPFIESATTDAERGLALARALHDLGADDEAVAVLHHGLSRTANASVAKKAAEWLERVGRSDDAATIRSGLGSTS